MTAGVESTLAQLAALEERMRGFLSLVALRDTSESALQQAWNTCEAHTPALSSLGSVMHRANEDERAALRKVLASIACLNAVAAMQLVDEKAGVSELLRRTRKARDDFGYYAPNGELGSSCDIAG